MKLVLLIAAGMILLGGIVAAGWLFVGSCVTAATGTLPGGWDSVYVSMAGILAGTIGPVVVLFWFAMRRPKPLRE
jgi:hypothetical protein